MQVEPTGVDTIEQELSDFSYIVSHDLTASFRHVSEFSGLVLRELGPNANATLLSHGAHLQSAADKCQQMMDQLLAFSRVQQKALVYKRSDLALLMEVATLQLSAEVREAHASVSIEPLGLQAVDADLITLAFKHALDNAIKFRDPESAPRIKVSGEQGPDFCIVRIADNGIGVALERQEKMFRMFYNDHAEGAYPGIGAGLAICRRIMRRHGGEVQFVETGLGACLEFKFPAIAGFDAPPSGDAS